MKLLNVCIPSLHLQYRPPVGGTFEHQIDFPQVPLVIKITISHVPTTKRKMQPGFFLMGRGAFAQLLSYPYQLSHALVG